jgi:antagonist of KipI
MTLFIEKPGILTTVQDLGRSGFRRYGINPNGPMDPAAARIANILVGNGDNAALLEMHFPAARVRFEADAVYAICGGDFGAELDGSPVARWRALNAAAGSTLQFTSKVTGERMYLAISGGISLEPWLGSRSTNLTAAIGGFQGRALAAGDRLPLGTVTRDAPRRALAAGRSILPRYSQFPTVRIVAGAEFGDLTRESRTSLLNASFTVDPSSNRMGFRLVGDRLRTAEPIHVLSSATAFGTIQLLPDGQMVVLMADHQSTGGYPRVANVISTDLPLLGQLGAGDKLAFHLVEIAEAERVALQFEKELSFLRAACRLAYGCTLI